MLNLDRRKGTPHDVAVFTEGETFSSKKDFGICMKTDQSDMTYYSVPVCYHDSFLRRRRHQSILFCHCENPDFVLHQIHHIMPRCSSSRRVPSAAHTKLAHYVAWLRHYQTLRTIASGTQRFWISGYLQYQDLDISNIWISAVACELLEWNRFWYPITHSHHSDSNDLHAIHLPNFQFPKNHCGTVPSVAPAGYHFARAKLRICDVVFNYFLCFGPLISI